MNQEETVWDIQTRVIRMEKKLDKLMAYVIPEKEDKSKCTVSARLSTSCEQPSNHGKEGNLPRHVPNEEKKEILCWECSGKNKAVYIWKECHHYGLCKECYKKPNSELRHPKEEYEPIRVPKKSISGTDEQPKKKTRCINHDCTNWDKECTVNRDADNCAGFNKSLR